MLEKMKMIWQDAKQLKDERGLTLVELLVVVVILGIIAAIAVVAIGGIIENSKKDAMVADAKQMVSSAKLYTASNPVEGTTVLNFLSTSDSEASTAENVTTPAKVGAKSYVSNMKDPFGSNNANYSVAEVSITRLDDGTYDYEVDLTGSEFEVEDKKENALNKKALTAL